MTGFIVSAYAIGPIPLSYLAFYLINPNNLKADTKIPGRNDLIFGKEVAENVPYFLRVFSGVCFVIGMIGVALILDPLHENQTLFEDSKEIELLDISDNGKKG